MPRPSPGSTSDAAGSDAATSSRRPSTKPGITGRLAAILTGPPTTETSTWYRVDMSLVSPAEYVLLRNQEALMNRLDDIVKIMAVQYKNELTGQDGGKGGGAEVKSEMKD